MGEGENNGENQGGELPNKDAIYAMRFWRRQPPGMKEVMIENIHKAAEDGFIGGFIDPYAESFTEKEKERLSAYRLLAKAQGYEVGQFVRHPKEGTCSAPITKQAK